MNCLSQGLRNGALKFPESNGTIEWERFSLSQLLA